MKAKQPSQAGSSLAAILFLLPLLAWSTGYATASTTNPETIVAALASSARSADDRSNDESRKPAAFLEFLGLQPGDVVAEINAGSGYYARIYPNLVGEEGHVYVTNARFVLELFDGIQERLAKILLSFSNVTLSTQDDNYLSVPRPLDVAILNNIYHDLHWQELDLSLWNRSIYDSLRPGGHYIVADHAAAAGSGNRDAAELHRIDPAFVKREVLSASFELVEESALFRNPADDHSLMIIRPEIRGQTDRFLFRFRKPE
jgi:predicted methyltransferase